ncbi:MAG: helix-turn-helix transcriptional regulator, partial [Delftia sp.]|nr:helix-turn-helix transcriptional regulator [Delftia sp.]
MDAAYNHLLLNLYRLSHEQPVEHFQDQALDLLKPVLPFDSAMWGSATMTTAGI